VHNRALNDHWGSAVAIARASLARTADRSATNTGLPAVSAPMVLLRPALQKWGTQPRHTVHLPAGHGQRMAQNLDWAPCCDHV